MPSRARASSRSASGTAQFLSDKGSMEGRIRNFGQAMGRAKAGMENTAAS